MSILIIFYEALWERGMLWILSLEKCICTYKNNIFLLLQGSLNPRKRNPDLIKLCNFINKWIKSLGGYIFQTTNCIEHGGNSKLWVQIPIHYSYNATLILCEHGPYKSNHNYPVSFSCTKSRAHTRDWVWSTRQLIESRFWRQADLTYPCSSGLENIWYKCRLLISDISETFLIKIPGEPHKLIDEKSLSTCLEHSGKQMISYLGAELLLLGCLEITLAGSPDFKSHLVD